MGDAPERDLTPEERQQDNSPDGRMKALEHEFTKKLEHQKKAYAAERPAEHELSPEMKDHYDTFTGDIGKHEEKYSSAMEEVNAKFAKQLEAMMKSQKDERKALYMPDP